VQDEHQRRGNPTEQCRQPAVLNLARESLFRRLEVADEVGIGYPRGHEGVLLEVVARHGLPHLRRAAERHRRVHCIKGSAAAASANRERKLRRVSENCNAFVMTISPPKTLLLRFGTRRLTLHHPLHAFPIAPWSIPIIEHPCVLISF
jgi:hypothetical protein